MPSAIQSALQPAGIEALRIVHLWWIFFWVCTVVWVLVTGATLMAVASGRRGTSAGVNERRVTGTVAAATAVSTVALLILLTTSVVTDRVNASLDTTNALQLQITGWQWWWDVQYTNPQASLNVVTANEIHIPVGRPIRVTLLSGDVIHSLWIPPLNGKTDLIPGRANEIWFIADRPGVYRGQCAEFCGTQHAKMALTVVAEPEDQFQRWLTAQRSPAASPTTPSEQRGREIVERGPCAMCHAIQGSTAGARTAPDLTHIATRSTIGAGSVPNTRGYLAGWIADPQHVKPGNKMPAPGLSSEQLLAVLDYLESLK